MATSLTLENDSSLAQGYIKVNGSTAATLTTSGITANLTGNVTGSLTSGGSITLATSQTASGTAVNFTGIPSWAKRITVMFNGVSTNGSSIVQVQIGASTFSTSGYKSNASYSSGASTFAYATSGFILEPAATAVDSAVRSGVITLILINSNTWCYFGTIGTGTPNLVCNSCAGSSPALSGALDRLRVTTVNGTDTFDAGTINISYEG